MHSVLSHLQFPHGVPHMTSQRTLRARQRLHAIAARFLTLTGGTFAAKRLLLWFGHVLPLLLLLLLMFASVVSFVAISVFAALVGTAESSGVFIFKCDDPYPLVREMELSYGQ
jgi:hypothetical protein